jgi:hypothetical protein
MPSHFCRDPKGEERIMARQVVTIVTAPYRLYNNFMCLRAVNRRLRGATA